MTDVETALIIKNMAREAVRQMTATVRNAEHTFTKTQDHTKPGAYKETAVNKQKKTSIF
jgi:hypothetical protein